MAYLGTGMEGNFFFRLGWGRQMQPVKPHPMQQYTLVPIRNPLDVAQRVFLRRQVGQTCIGDSIIFRRYKLD